MLVIPESERVKRSINDPRIRVDVRAHVYRRPRSQGLLGFQNGCHFENREDP